MYHKPRVPDHQIVQRVTTQLPRHGIRPPCNVRVHVRNGTVTLSGTIEFEMQRKAAVHAATGVNGVQRVIDNLTVMRNTIGGWHAKSAGMQLKHVPSHPPTPPPTKAPAQSESDSDQSPGASVGPTSPSEATPAPTSPSQVTPAPTSPSQVTPASTSLSEVVPQPEAAAPAQAQQDTPTATSKVVK